MAYASSNSERMRVKQLVLEAIASDSPFRLRARAIWMVGHVPVHIRYKHGPCASSFNISRTTLSAELELWICGSAVHWYLMPTFVLREIYEHPDAYRDTRHPDLVVASVHAGNHTALYARPGIKLDLSEYYRAIVHQ